MSRKGDIPTQLRQRGQVTVPAEVRRELNLKEGDYILIDIEPLSGGKDD